MRGWSESRDRILKALDERTPRFAESFREFLTGMENTTDFTQARLWEDAPFGLVDIKDERIT